MALPKARDGVSIGFHLYSGISKESTRGNREQIVWSSIKHLCTAGVADRILHYTYRITNKKLRNQVATNIKLYINQAFAFYSAALKSETNTSPLLYYYCFLNLAKALCEIKHPNFHQMQECYRHGISWRPNSEYMVDLTKESVYLSNRGVWHILWEKVTGQTSNLLNPTYLKIKNLLSCCPELSTEYERVFSGPSKYIDLIEPDILFDTINDEFWIKFSVSRNDLRYARLSRHKFINLISNGNNWYRQVKSTESHLLTFELAIPKKLQTNPPQTYSSLLESEIKSMNPFVHPGTDDFDYYVPIQISLPVQLPQLLLLYTLIFWLGSLVRYDPHSIAYLRESRFWIIIDGFLSQSRLCLLELFEWEFYQVSTHLKYV